VFGGAGIAGKVREKNALSTSQTASMMKNGENNTVSVSFSAAC
jgi:hypothetical protein